MDRGIDERRVRLVHLRDDRAAHRSHVIEQRARRLEPATDIVGQLSDSGSSLSRSCRHACLAVGAGGYA